MSVHDVAVSTKAGGALFALAVVVFVALGIGEGEGDRNVMAIPVVIAWAAALWALRPLVAKNRYSALYFAFGVMAFIMFFIYATYDYHGKLRYFPLIVGWSGVLLSLLDILSLTETRLAKGINIAFGVVHPEPQAIKRGIGREIACFAAMASSVLLIWGLGFLIASPLFVFLWMRIWGAKSLRHSVYGGVYTLAFIWIMFEWILQYELYRGVLVEWIMDWMGG